ncbi:unnamed protein product, partial [Meganyctiphanes norvegica]
NNENRTFNGKLNEIEDNINPNIDPMDNTLSNLKGQEVKSITLDIETSEANKIKTRNSLDYVSKSKAFDGKNKQNIPSNKSDSFKNSQIPQFPYMKREDSSLNDETKRIVMSLMDRSKSQKDICKSHVGVQDKMQMLMNKNNEVKPGYSKYSPRFVSSMIRNTLKTNSKPEYSVALKPINSNLNTKPAKPKVFRANKTNEQLKPNINNQKINPHPTKNAYWVKKEQSSVHQINSNLGNVKQDNK